ncbi:MAG: ABC transporter permease [Planctomycetia bacterium]|nr:ABC transporter permease [Planctomycetia bacterium]
MILFGVWYNWIVPLWIVVAGVLVQLALLWSFRRLLYVLFPRVEAVVRTTAKECVSQSLFFAVIFFGILLVGFSAFLPYSTFGDDLKMMKDTGLMMILVLSIILAVSSAAVSISEEVDGRTALTVLSKPIGRREFVVGKMLGVLMPVVIYYIIMGAFFLAMTSYKVKFEARENSLPDPAWMACQAEMIQTAPALFLCFLETIVMTAISVAISTRLAMVPNMLICATIYVVGHMTPLLVQSSIGKLPIVAFVGQFLSTLLPVLEHFNIQAAIASGRDSVLTVAQWGTYLGWATLYCALYTGIMLLVSLLMFEDRDLA